MKLYNIISQVMDVPISAINDQSSPKTIENWDSFRVLMLLNEIETEYNIKFNFDDISNLQTVKDIKVYLQKSGVTIE